MSCSCDINPTYILIVNIIFYRKIEKKNNSGNNRKMKEKRANQL